MELRVDPIQRYAKTRAHTATHLLHTQLAAIFPQTKQAGSLVDEDYLRFDFYSDTLLTGEQILQIQSNINTTITQALPVSTQEVSYDDAIKAGAKAFFEDKYGNVVRVVTIKSPLSKGDAEDRRISSIELCGGTHVSNTKNIGAFTIISQEAVASGIKRIIAVTGPKVVDELTTKNTELKHIAQLLGVQEKQITDKITKTLREYNEIQQAYEKINTMMIGQHIKDGVATGKKFAGYTLIALEKTTPFKDAIQYAKQEPVEILIYNEEGSFGVISPSGQAKTFAQSHKLRGGGSDQLFQGKDPAILALLAG